MLLRSENKVFIPQELIKAIRDVPDGGVGVKVDYLKKDLGV